MQETLITASDRGIDRVQEAEFHSGSTICDDGVGATLEIGVQDALH